MTRQKQPRVRRQLPVNGSIYRRYIKRPMDFLLALGAIIVLGPVMLVIAILVRLDLGSPVLFKQQRPGLHEKLFTLYKFRTMSARCGSDGQLLPDELRLTRFGRWLRSTSLDELPELFNILRGEMSIVGPRPLLPDYLPLYNQHQKRRHEVRPGLSGLAQVGGRNNLSWEARFDLDVQYVDTLSFSGDWRIIGLTFSKVLRREGINSRTAATMEAFQGAIIVAESRSVEQNGSK